jgi:hypothetical protein
LVGATKRITQVLYALGVATKNKTNRMNACMQNAKPSALNFKISKLSLPTPVVSTVQLSNVLAAFTSVTAVEK